MRPQGRPKGEFRNAQHGGCLMRPQGRPKGDNEVAAETDNCAKRLSCRSQFRNAQHGGCLMRLCAHSRVIGSAARQAGSHR